MVTPAGELATAHVLPSGRLREPLERADTGLALVVGGLGRRRRGGRRAHIRRARGVRLLATSRRARRGAGRRPARRRARRGAVGDRPARAVRRVAARDRVAGERRVRLPRSPPLLVARPRWPWRGRSTPRAPGACSRPTRTPCDSKGPGRCRLPLARVPLTLDVPRWDALTALVTSAIARRRAPTRPPRHAREAAASLESRRSPWTSCAPWSACRPSRSSASWARASGWLFYVLDAPHRRVALANLAQCFPARTVAERRAIARAHVPALRRAPVRAAAVQRALARRDARAASTWTAKTACAPPTRKGKGVLFFTGHFGFWELHGIGHALVLRAHSPCSRARSTTHACTCCSRPCAQCTGNTVIYREGAVRKILRMLGAGHGVAMLIDQHMHSPDAIWVQFFQRPAATTSTLAALALRTGAPVIPVFALPLPGGRFRMIYEHPVEPPAAGLAGPGPRVHPALHRRARDVRAPSARAVAVDAPPLARCAGARDRRHVPRPLATGATPMPERVVVVAPNWLGDAVMALPALRTLRAHLPAGAPGRGGAAQRRRRCSRWCRASTRSCRSNREGAGPARAPLASRRRAAGRRALRPGAAAAELVPVGRGSSSQAGIPERWGYATDWRGPLLTRRLRRPAADVHQADYYLALTAAAGMPDGATCSPRRCAAGRARVGAGRSSARRASHAATSCWRPGPPTAGRSSGRPSASRSSPRALARRAG